MIQRRTVFVLGAGASMPYGFPSGPALRHEICTTTLTKSSPCYNILRDLGHRDQDVNECRTAIARSWAASIDMFIATRPEHAEIAKAAIAYTIARYEADDALFFANPQTDWFRYLWRQLQKNYPESFSLVSFVTFNYDRTLEHSFANGMQHAYGRAEVRKDLLPRIVPVYGSLGQYPFADCEGARRNFGAESTAENIEQSRSFNVISEKTVTSLWPTEAQSLLDRAHQIVLLGFGYDEMNLRVLRMHRHDCCLKKECQLYGTAMNLMSQERDWIEKNVGRNGDNIIRLAKQDVDCLMFLRENFDLLS